jgi:iron-sulfur cluster repair protein YtfE (RIC family)
MNLEEFGPDAKEEMSPSEYIQYCLERYREYTILAMDPTINDQATKLYLDKASEYYARAQEAMDEIEPDMTDHLSDEDKALPNVPLDEKDEELSDKDKAMVDDYEEEEANREVPRDYASMYERLGKLAGLDK